MKYANMRRHARVVFFLCSFMWVHHAHAASLNITEIMFDPSGSDDKREWVEVYNADSAPLDISGHYILTDGLSSSKHALVPQGSASLAPGTYAVIVQDVAGFKADFPKYTGQIFDSSWSGLTATVGKTILVVDPDLTPLDSVTYDPSIGATNTGDSLQKTHSGVWVALPPTPGEATDQIDGESDENDTDESSDDTNDQVTHKSVSIGGVQAGSTTSKPALPVSKPHAELLVPARAVAGIPVKITARAYDTGDTLRIFGVTHVSLGDGNFHTGVAIETFSYTYTVPGTYVIVVEYRGNPYSTEPDMLARATIEVSDPTVSISNITANGTIVLANTSSREADISSWVLAPSGDAYTADAFRFPSGTVMLAGMKISLVPQITGFRPDRAREVRLFLPSGEPAEPVLTELERTESSVVRDTVVFTPIPSMIATNVAIQANALESVSKIFDHEPVEKDYSPLPYIIGLVILLAAASIVVWKFGFSEKDMVEEVSNALESKEYESGPKRVISEKDDIHILE